MKMFKNYDYICTNEYGIRKDCIIRIMGLSNNRVTLALIYNNNILGIQKFHKNLKKVDPAAINELVVKFCNNLNSGKTITTSSGKELLLESIRYTIQKVSNKLGLVIWKKSSKY